MINSIFRHVTNKILITTFAITVVLCLVITLLQSLRLFDLIINHNLPALHIFNLMGLLLPRFINVALPLAFFMAVIFCYQRMKNDSEIVVLQSAGLSHLSIARPIILSGLVIVLIVYFFSLYLTPWSLRNYSKIIHAARTDIATSFVKPGRFIAMGNGVTVYVRERIGEDEFAGIFVHDTTNPEQEQTITANKGRITFTEDGPRLEFDAGHQQFIAQDQFHLFNFKKHRVTASNLASKDKGRWKEPEERFLNELFNPDLSDGNNVQFLNALYAEGHKRLTSPFMALVYGLISGTIILLTAFNRMDKGWLVPALSAIIVIIILALQLGTASLVRTSPSLFFIPYIFPISVPIICFYLLSRHSWSSKKFQYSH